jgi:hypothetical protein
MKPFASLAVIVAAAGSALALGACLVDLTHLSGGKPGGVGGGAASGGGAGGSAATTSDATATSGTGGDNSTMPVSTASTGSGAGGMINPGCGASVLDCSGCACPAGGCAAVPLATGADADGPRGIATSSDGVFWVDKAGGRIMGILAQGGGPQLLVKGNSPTTLAVASGRIAYVAQDGLWTCLLPSCDATKKHLAGSIAPGSVQSVAYDGGLVYWADRGDDANAGNGVVWSCDPATDCGSPFKIVDQVLYAQGLFLTADSLFWMAQGNGQANGSIHRSPRTGTGNLYIATALVLPSGLAADDTYVYWAQATASGAVLRCDYTQAPCTKPDDVAPAAGPLGLPVDLAIAGGRVYWNENTGGTLSSCPLPGCGAAESPRVHATGRQGVHRIAVGSSCLFWTDDVNGGSVDKVGR